MTDRPICKKCKVAMKVGKAIQNGYSAGLPDFIGDTDGQTMSLDATKVKLVNCWKCPKCGHSISA